MSIKLYNSFNLTIKDFICGDLVESKETSIIYLICDTDTNLSNINIALDVRNDKCFPLENLKNSSFRRIEKYNFELFL